MENKENKEDKISISDLMFGGESVAKPEDKIEIKQEEQKKKEIKKIEVDPETEKNLKKLLKEIEDIEKGSSL
jgi:hypothetical protein